MWNPKIYLLILKVFLITRNIRPKPSFYNPIQHISIIMYWTQIELVNQDRLRKHIHNLTVSTDCFTDLDQGSKIINFESVLTTFIVSHFYKPLGL